MQPAAPPPPRLLDRMREAIRVRHYSIRTEDTYVDWARRYIVFHDKRHPLQMGPAEVAALLTHLAVQRNVAPATQGQASSALLFLYRVVLEVQLPWLDGVVAANGKRRLPVVLTTTEVRSLLHELNGTRGAWWRRCCTAPACGCSRACACGSSVSASSAANGSCAMAMAPRTA